MRELEKRLSLWLAATRYRQFADAVQAMAPGQADEERRVRWIEWLRSYAVRVEREVLRELPDPECGPDPRWRY